MLFGGASEWFVVIYKVCYSYWVGWFTVFSLKEQTVQMHVKCTHWPNILVHKNEYLLSVILYICLLFTASAFLSILWMFWELNGSLEVETDCLYQLKNYVHLYLCIKQYIITMCIIKCIFFFSCFCSFSSCRLCAQDFFCGAFFAITWSQAFFFWQSLCFLSLFL